MKRVDWSIIQTGAPVGAIREMFEAEQQARLEFAIGLVKNKIGSYDATKVYAFGAADCVWSVNGSGNVTFRAPSGCMALFNNQLFSIPAMATDASDATSLRLKATTVTTGITKDDSNTLKNIVFNDTLEVVASTTSGTLISFDKVVPLFMYEVVTDWTPISAATGAVDVDMDVRRDGIHCYIRGFGRTGTSGGLALLTGLFVPISNAVQSNQPILIAYDLAGTIQEGIVRDDGLIVGYNNVTNKSTRILNGHYTLL